MVIGTTASFFLQLLAMLLPIVAAALLIRIMVTEFEKERDVARTLSNLWQARRSFLEEVAHDTRERAELERRVKIEHGRVAAPQARPTPRPAPVPGGPAPAPAAAALRSVPPAALGAALRQMMSGGAQAAAAGAR